MSLANERLAGLEINRAYTSVGSNIFFKFGQQIEETLPSGKKTLASEWTLWISNASWRMTQGGRYFVGSEDEHEKIADALGSFFGRRLCSLSISSDYFDAEVCFEDGYKLNAFFNWSVENQWLLFFPDKTEFIIDCSDPALIHSLQLASRQIKLERQGERLENFSEEEAVDSIVFENSHFSKILFNSGLVIDLGMAAWRFEKRGEYVLGKTDCYFECKEGRLEECRSNLFELIGKKVKHLNLSPDGLDAAVHLSDGCLLEIFTSSPLHPWKIERKRQLICGAETKMQ